MLEVNFSAKDIDFYNLDNVVSIKTQAAKSTGRHILFINNSSVANISFDEYLKLAESFKVCRR